jgi:hypothetical protein
MMHKGDNIRVKGIVIAIASILILSTAVMSVSADTAMIWTDKEDYSPGDTVTIYGSGFNANAEITITIVQPNGTVDTITDVYSDENGSFNAYYVINNDDPVGLYTVTATDGTNTASTTFTDSSNKVGSVSVLPTSNTVTAGGTATYTVTVNRGLGNAASGAFDANLSIDESTLPSDTTATFNPNTVHFTPTDNSQTSTLTIKTSTTTPSGTYTFKVKATRNDNADDNAISDTVTLIVNPPSDTTRPTITASRNPPANANGWNNTDVTLEWTIEDTGSGIDTSSLSSDCGTIKSGSEEYIDGKLIRVVTSITVSDEGIRDLTCSAKDVAGNTGSNTETVRIDKTRPTVKISGINDRQQFDFGDSLPSVTCYAEDSLSGIESASCTIDGSLACIPSDGSCTITPETLPTSVDTHTITATAKDNAGNVASTSISYEIVAWTIKGFYQPVDNPPIVNVAKAGSTIPLKFEVFKTLRSDEEITDTSKIKQLMVQRTSNDKCNGLAPDNIDLEATGGTSLRYDPIEGQFIYNWKTPSYKNTCWQVTVYTIDGSSISALFWLK